MRKGIGWLITNLRKLFHLEPLVPKAGFEVLDIWNKALSFVAMSFCGFHYHTPHVKKTRQGEEEKGNITCLLISSSPCLFTSRFFRLINRIGNQAERRRHRCRSFGPAGSQTRTLPENRCESPQAGSRTTSYPQ